MDKKLKIHQDLCLGFRLSIVLLDSLYNYCTGT